MSGSSLAAWLQAQGGASVILYQIEKLSSNDIILANAAPVVRVEQQAFQIARLSDIRQEGEAPDFRVTGKFCERVPDLGV